MEVNQNNMTLLEHQFRAAGYQGPFELESLIEACGEKFYKLKQEKDGWSAMSRWEGKDSFTCVVRGGTTRKEAVGWLLLSLLQDKSA